MTTYGYVDSVPTWSQLSPYINDELLRQLIHVEGTPMTRVQKDFWDWVATRDWRG